MEADFHVSCPSGGTLVLQSGQDNTLQLVCSDGKALWDVMYLLSGSGLGLDLSTLRLLRSPLQQPLNVLVAGEPFLRWNPGKLPKVASVRRLFSWLRSR